MGMGISVMQDRVNQFVDPVRQMRQPLKKEEAVKPKEPENIREQIDHADGKGLAVDFSV